MAKRDEAPDMTAEEYNYIMELLLFRAVTDIEALVIANSIKDKFGASVRRREERNVT